MYCFRVNCVLFQGERGPDGTAGVQTGIRLPGLRQHGVRKTLHLLLTVTSRNSDVTQLHLITSGSVVRAPMPTDVESKHLYVIYLHLSKNMYLFFVFKLRLYIIFFSLCCFLGSVICHPKIPPCQM